MCSTLAVETAELPQLCRCKVCWIKFEQVNICSIFTTYFKVRQLF